MQRLQKIIVLQKIILQKEKHLFTVSETDVNKYKKFLSRFSLNQLAITFQKRERNGLGCKN